MSNLESLRKEAKSLLKQCRTGNTAAVARVRSQLPRLGLHIQLADVQHALARERGFANWALVTAFPDVVRQMDADDENEIIKLAACTDAKVVRTVMESGFDLARTGAGGSTALHIAAWQGHLQPVRTLLDFHAPVNALDVTFGSSPLTWAAHGSKYCRNADDDYSAVVQAIFDAGGTWIDRRESSPEAIASPGIAALFRRLNSN